MISIKFLKDKPMCTLEECPPGLFIFDGTLGLKTEYGMEVDGKWWPQAFVASSGEVFWGGVHTHEERAALQVQPLLEEKC